jgi:hypothetical protein
VASHRDLSPDLDGEGEISPEEWFKTCLCFDVKNRFLNPSEASFS